MNRRRGIKNIIWSAVGQIASILAGLIIGRLIISVYGSASNGLINSVNQVFAYFILLEAGVGMASLQSLYLPVASDDKKSISAIISATKRYYDRTSILYLGAVLIFAAVYSLWIGNTSAADGVNSFTMAGVIVVTGLGNVLNFAYQGKYKILLQAEGKNYVVTNAQTLLTVLGCILKIIAIHAGFSLIAVMAAGFIANVIQTAFYYYYISRNYRWIDLKEPPAKLEQNRSVFIHQVSQLVFQNTDVIILTVVCGLRVVSVYAVYKVVVNAVGTFTYQFSESLLFILGQGYATDREKYCDDIDLFDQIFTMLSFAAFTAALALYLPFIRIYTRGVADISYTDAVLPIMFVSIELISGLRKSMQNTITVSGHFKQTVKRSVAETVINLGVSLALVPFMGIYGVLIGTIAALLYRSNDIIIYGNRRILGRSPLGSYKLYIVNLIAFIPTVFICFSEIVSAGSYGGLLLCTLLVCLASAAWYVLINVLFFRKRMKQALGRIIGKR